MTKLTKDSVIEKNPIICSREFDGETVMMDSKLENYFGLEKVGTRIWQLLDEPQQIDALCTKLTAEYNVNKEQCIEDPLPFLEQLLTDEILVIVSS